jgi:hypothetical protein
VKDCPQKHSFIIMHGGDWEYRVLLFLRNQKSIAWIWEGVSTWNWVLMAYLQLGVGLQRAWL